MRIIYKILLGMLVFNLLYLSFADFFPTGEADIFTAGDTNEDIDEYKNINDRIIFNMLLAGATTFIGSLAALLALSWVSRGGVSLSVGSVITITTVATIISTIWSGFSSIFQPMLAIGGSIASDFYTIFVIVLGVIIALTLAEMFSGQSGVDA